MNRNCRKRSLGCQARDSWARNKDFKAAGPTVILAGPMLGPSQKTDFRRGKGWGFDPLPWRMTKERSRKLEQELGPRLMLIKIDNKQNGQVFHAPSSGCHPGLTRWWDSEPRPGSSYSVDLHRKAYLPALNLPHSSLASFRARNAQIPSLIRKGLPKFAGVESALATGISHSLLSEVP